MATLTLAYKPCIVSIDIALRFIFLANDPSIKSICAFASVPEVASSKPPVKSNIATFDVYDDEISLIALKPNPPLVTSIPVTPPFVVEPT